MIEQLEMWKNYFYHILNHPLHISIFIFSFTFSIVFYLLFKRTADLKRKVNFLAMHIALLFFPFIFSAVFWKCMMPMMNCSPMMFIIFAPISIILAVITGFVILPYIYRWSYSSNLVKMGFIKELIAEQSKVLSTKEPELYSVNDIKPFAYSITNLKPAIFISAGLSELLTKKEMEAVLLHELYHHKSKAYLWKFSGNILRLFTPVIAFTGVSISLEKEENEADNYAISVQKTSKYLNSAKAKASSFIGFVHLPDYKYNN